MEGTAVSHRRQMGMIPKQNNRESLLNTAPKQQERIKNYNHSYSEYIKEKAALLLAGTVANVYISPFDDAWLADNWKRVADVTLLPVASVGAERQIKKYGHFIYGFAGEHFYLAVPGRHTEEEWPDRGQSGFMLWQSIKNSKEYGYWCAVIDWKMGIITEIS
jgi:hypothetical protein